MPEAKKREDLLPGQPLSTEGDQAFTRLGLAHGEWEVLLPLPYIQVAWSDNVLTPAERDGLGSNLGGILQQIRRVLPGAGEPRPLSDGAGRFLKGLLRFGEAREQEQERLTDAIGLLCWHLARNYDWGQREGLLRHLWKIGQASVLQLRADQLAAVLGEMRRRIDGYLPRARFEVLPTCRPAAPKIAELQVRVIQLTWHSLLIVPLARLVLENRDAKDSTLLVNAMERVLANYDAGSAHLSWDFLAQPWRELFPELAEQWGSGKFASRERQLIHGLAEVDYCTREVLLSCLARVAGRVRLPWFYIPARTFSPDRIEQWLDNLRQKVDEIRQGFGEPAAPDQAPAQPPLILSAAEVSVPPEAPPLRIGWTPVHGPSPFETVPWENALGEAREISMAEVRQLVSTPLLFENYCGENEHVAVVPPDAVPPNLWIIGDLHCDLLAMVNAWSYIRKQAQVGSDEPHLLFLGDFVDRGRHGYETLLYLFRLIRDNPGRIGVIVGNHDEDYRWNESTGRFQSGVDPAETTEMLNELVGRDDEESRARVEVGKLGCAFFGRRPRAVFLPDGLLVTHGGFPHTDLLESLNGRADLSRKECLQDFVWLRLGEGARKRPFRGERGCEFGYADFARFCERAGQKLGLPVRRLVRGHDHIARSERYEAHPDWPNPILTLNTMCRQLDSESLPSRFPKACVARHVPGQLPDVHVLPIDEKVIEMVYFASEISALASP